MFNAQGQLVRFWDEVEIMAAAMDVYRLLQTHLFQKWLLMKDSLLLLEHVRH